MFEKQLVPLNPKYNVTHEEGEFSITENESYVNLTKDYRLNFLALCGRNGVGKSTFLRLLSGRHSHESEYTVCWIDSSGEIACTNSIKLSLHGALVALDSTVHDYALSDLCGNKNLGDYDEENHVRRSLLSVYSNDPALFNLHGTSVFDGFHLDRPTGAVSEIMELERELSEHLGISKRDGVGQLDSIAKSHPTFHVLASIAQDSTFQDLARKGSSKRPLDFETIFRILRDKESDHLDDEINRLIYEGGVQGSHLQRISKGSVSDPQWCRYSIEQYAEIREKVSALSSKVDEWMEKKLRRLKAALWESEHLNLHIWKGRLSKLISFQPYRDYGGKLFHLTDLSDGEYAQIKLLFNLAPMVWPEHACWFHFDDIDDYLHPEWKRSLIQRIATTHFEITSSVAKVTKISRYAEKVNTCIVATHSPFVLSDLPKESVLRFTKDANGKTKIKRADESTFAGNIGELFHTEFFMETTVGEFARRAIKKVIKELENNPNPEIIESASQLFDNVGDEVLRKLLIEKVQRCKELK
ncbi:MAG: hypothetical protein GVY36_09345 [Verrucomicrobia bacterium]|jgi:predicted ATPase|nr:hypothetical protein [Verrucomicrobiota bacterium]